MRDYGVTVLIRVEADSKEEAERIVRERTRLKWDPVTQVTFSEARGACYCGAVGDYHAVGCEA